MTILLEDDDENYLVIRGVGSEVLAICGPVQLDHMGGVTEAATQPAVLPVVLLHLHQHRDHTGHPLHYSF